MSLHLLKKDMQLHRLVLYSELHYFISAQLNSSVSAYVWFELT